MTRARVMVRLLRLSADRHGVSISTSVVRERPWASALFTGTRLTIAVTADDDAALDAWLIALPDLDLPIEGHFVADADVVARDTGAATIELLLIAD